MGAREAPATDGVSLRQMAVADLAAAHALSTETPLAASHH